ncbi:unnamed protein product [Paramecium sonneborni]|uniref:PITH domain-containing protein n=1 Tax=Paramecium sonneborni TaxID=65129 RepID=A0A8S1M6W8_9CILI|nr:unnamed protein product [Paramecium sonneborni]
MQHVHGPNCGCAEYMFNEDADDLYGQIEIDKVDCLNETAQNIKQIIRPEKDKTQKNHYVQSDLDSEIIIIIPFNETVRIRQINVVSLNEQSAANFMKAYTNISNVDFGLIETPCAEQFVLSPNLDGQFGNAVKVSKFENVNNLVLYIKSTINDPIRISYVGLKGIRTFQSKQLANTIYELNPLAKQVDPDKVVFDSVC